MSTEPVQLTTDQARRLVRELFAPCDACGRERLHEDLGKYSADASAYFGLADGEVTISRLYCADSPTCASHALLQLQADLERSGWSVAECGARR